MVNGLQDNLKVNVTLQDKRGIYQAILSYKDIDGKWKTKWKSTGIKIKPGNKKLAKEKAEIIREKFEQEMKYKLKPKRTGIEAQLDMEFIDFMNMRLEEVNLKRKYEYDTYCGYKSNINVRMRQFFGSSQDNDNTTSDSQKEIYLVKDITAEIIDEFFNFLSIDCKLKNTTIKHFKKQISVAYEVLEKKGIMSKPTNSVEPLKEEVFIPNVYSMNELNKLLQIIKDDVIEIPVLLASYYGLRRSEAVGLKWSAVDFEEGFIYINHTVIQTSTCANKLIEGKLIAKDRTKCIHSNRKLPLYDNIKKVLIEKQERIALNKQIFKNSYNTEYLEYICVKDDGDIIKPSHISKRFLKIIRRNNLKEIRFHDLRHTIATELSATGVDLKSIGEFLGHGNLSTTKRYAHPDDRVKQNVANLYNSLINNSTENNTMKKEKKFIVKKKVQKK